VPEQRPELPGNVPPPKRSPRWASRRQRRLSSTSSITATNSPEYLPSSAKSPDYHLAGPATEAELQAALPACLAKGWLQVIDEPTLAKIADELREGRLLGPVYGLPEVGGVDFTHAGAELWQRVCGKSGWALEVVHSKTARYFPTRPAALASIEEIRNQDGVVSVVGPTPIGPWRAEWWRRFPEGYRIDIEEKRQWQGRCGEGEGCFMPQLRRESDPQRLRHVLDRHNLTLAEWLLLAVRGDGLCIPAARLPRWVSGSAGKHFGVTASEDECRIGLDACLRHGWLRVVDKQAADEVHALLREDAAMMPVPREAGSGLEDIDFTPCGATLYRMIAAEWLGPDWEDDLQVWKEYYREEHQYGVTEEGLRGIVEDHEARGEVVRSSKLVPIGPWCVFWWERFPAGFRVEIEIGEP
jgi:hypothetical protein